MNPQEAAPTQTHAQPHRRLSIVRVAIAVVVTGALAFSGVVAAQTWLTELEEPVVSPWFAGYVDVTATPTFDFEAPAGGPKPMVVLSFIVADPKLDCVPSWGAEYTLDEAAISIELDRRLARLKQRNGEAIVSFGGADNDELASRCDRPAALAAAYAKVIDRYNVTTVDFDIEGDDLGNGSGVRRAEAVAALQKERRAAGDALAVWLTLPGAPVGLSSDGTTEVQEFLAAGVDLAGINVMTMDYGSSRAKGQSMVDASTESLTSVHRQLGVMYTKAGMALSDETLWAKLGATPMIGQNDVIDEVFTLADAAKLNAFARAHGMSRLSMWSLNRDTTCGPNYVNLSLASDSCSGIDQKEQYFSEILHHGMNGTPRGSADHTTMAEPQIPDPVDDPATSPYTIWSETAPYLTNTKVVWHRNVYQAKWWTKGDLPDDPVLAAWETPWELIGPVLPGEKPVPIPTLPAGTYAPWVGTQVYHQGERVMLEGIAFETKWWTQGDSPEAASSNPDSSPWVALTEKQLLEVLAGNID